MQRWAVFVARHRRAVIAVWALAVAAGLAASAWLGPLLTTSLDVPGSSSSRADSIVARHFGENVEGTFTIVFRGHPRGASVNAVLQRVAAQLPAGRVSPVEHAAGMEYANVASSLGLNAASSRTPAIRHAVAAAGALVTGPPAIQYDVSAILASDLRTGELVALAVAAAVIVASFGFSLSVFLPFVVALATTGCALGAVYLAAHAVAMVLYVPDVVQLIGLGLAVDYGLLVVHRYREELRARAGEVGAATGALAATLATAGRTVAASGAAVAAGLVVLGAVPVPFVRSLGIAGCLVPVFSVAAALSLLPACLVVLGPRAMAGWGRSVTGKESRAWTRFARRVVHKPLVPAALALGVLLVAAAPAPWLALTPASTAAIPARMPSAAGLALLRSRVGPGAITPLEIVIDAGAPSRALAAPVGEAVMRLAQELVAQPGVFVVAIGDRGQYVAGNGRYRRVIVVARQDFGSASARALVERLHSGLVGQARFPPGVRVDIGGAPAEGADFLDHVYGPLPWLLLAAFFIAYVVLARLWRSAILPVVTLALDSLSVAAAYGVTVAVFSLGAGFPFGPGRNFPGLYHVSQIEGWVPVFVLTMLFGLSMDYQVFMVARMREEVDTGTGPRRAVEAGLARTGPVVTAAAAVMVGALCGLAVSRIAGMQELGVGLAAGVALDATVVRAVLLPAIMSLIHRWNWWLPPHLAAALHLAPSPPGRHPVPGEE